MSGTDVPEDLVRVLKRLRLSGVLQTMELRVRDAVDGALSYDEFLRRILRDELDRVMAYLGCPTPGARSSSLIRSDRHFFTPPSRPLHS